MSAQGVDVSNYQGAFDWQSQAGLSFGFCRATQGLGAPGTNSPDPYLHWNWTQVGSKGLIRGAYHFLDPSLNGAEQARYFVQTLQGLGLTADDVLILDYETPSWSSSARDFMAELRTLRPHNRVLLYTYLSMAQSGYCTGLGAYDLYIAAYGNTAPNLAGTPWGAWRFWQWSSTPLDRDAFNGTASDLANWAGSFVSTPPLPQPLPEDEDMAVQLLPGTASPPVGVSFPAAGAYKTIGFVGDPTLAGSQNTNLRVAQHHVGGGWSVAVVTIESGQGGKAVLTLPGDCDGVSITRLDDVAVTLIPNFA